MPAMRLAACCSIIVLSFVQPASPAERQPLAAPLRIVPVILDTDIGGYIDDAFALGLILTSPDLELRGVTTVDGDAHTRAQLVCNFLYALNRSKIPVAAGAPPRAKPDDEGQMQYGLRPPYTRPVKQSAVEFLHEQLKSKPRELTILCVGPLTNIAALLEKHPETAKWIKRLVIMGGSLNVGYDGKPGAVPEWNIRQDVKAAQKVFTSGVPILLVPLDATAGLQADSGFRKHVFGARTLLTNHLWALNELSKETPVLHDALAVALSFDESLCRFRYVWIEVDDGGITQWSDKPLVGESIIRAAVSIEKERFLQWLAQRLAEPALSASDIGHTATIRMAATGDCYLMGNRLSPERIELLLKPAVASKPPLENVIIDADAATKWGDVRALIQRVTAAGVKRITAHSSKRPRQSTPVVRGNLPHRVHVVENYETDIERRWWLAAKLETKNVPEGSRRACRAVLCRDFDDQQGDKWAIYKAVIFNPVPGPPMGKNTRLTFRYHLQGTDSIRVQLYTLSKGYHRQLIVSGLPQGRWETATVDMTQALRPDGSGGPLSENERIDDIQFYVDAAAELFIDDIVLYDAALDDEKRPFPRHIHFTGWFDTGKQGAEWPGNFEIVEHRPPRTWKAAKSVPTADTKAPWIRVDLRGRRPITPNVRLRFRYQLKNSGRIVVELRLRDEKRSPSVSRLVGSPDEQGEFDLDFTDAFLSIAPPGGKPKPSYEATDIVFRVFPGGELVVDDVLLYEPGEATKGP